MNEFMLHSVNSGMRNERRDGWMDGWRGSVSIATTAKLIETLGKSTVGGKEYEHSDVIGYVLSH